MTRLPAHVAAGGHADESLGSPDIGAAIAEVLREAGLDVTDVPVDEVADLNRFEVVIIGSGVYAGRWLGEARTLVNRESATLRGRLVWLFSSGPVGDPPRPEADPVDAAEMVQLSGAQEHRAFAGRIDRSMLGLGERAIVSLVRAPEGDFRDWEEVREWARGIAAEVSARVPA